MVTHGRLLWIAVAVVVAIVPVEMRSGQEGTRCCEARLLSAIGLTACLK